MSSGDPEIVDLVRVEMMNVPLAGRAARITAAWKNAEMEKIRQEELKKSKQVKPTLETFPTPTRLGLEQRH